jgi:hypothetical protein
LFDVRMCWWGNGLGWICRVRYWPVWKKRSVYREFASSHAWRHGEMVFVLGLTNLC